MPKLENSQNEESKVRVTRSSRRAGSVDLEPTNKTPLKAHLLETISETGSTESLTPRRVTRRSIAPPDLSTPQKKSLLTIENIAKMDNLNDTLDRPSPAKRVTRRTSINSEDSSVKQPLPFVRLVRSKLGNEEGVENSPKRRGRPPNKPEPTLPDEKNIKFQVSSNDLIIPSVEETQDSKLDSPHYNTRRSISKSPSILLNTSKTDLSTKTPQKLTSLVETTENETNNNGSPIVQHTEKEDDVLVMDNTPVKPLRNKNILMQPTSTPNAANTIEKTAAAEVIDKSSEEDRDDDKVSEPEEEFYRNTSLKKFTGSILNNLNESVKEPTPTKNQNVSKVFYVSSSSDSDEDNLPIVPTDSSSNKENIKFVKAKTVSPEKKIKPRLTLNSTYNFESADNPVNNKEDLRNLSKSKLSLKRTEIQLNNIDDQTTTVVAKNHEQDESPVKESIINEMINDVEKSQEIVQETSAGNKIFPEETKEVENNSLIVSGSESESEEKIIKTPAKNTQNAENGSSKKSTPKSQTIRTPLTTPGQTFDSPKKGNNSNIELNDLPSVAESPRKSLRNTSVQPIAEKEEDKSNVEQKLYLTEDDVSIKLQLDNSGPSEMENSLEMENSSSSSSTDNQNSEEDEGQLEQSANVSFENFRKNLTVKAKSCSPAKKIPVQSQVISSSFHVGRNLKLDLDENLHEIQKTDSSGINNVSKTSAGMFVENDHDDDDLHGKSASELLDDSSTSKPKGFDSSVGIKQIVASNTSAGMFVEDDHRNDEFTAESITKAMNTSLPMRRKSGIFFRELSDNEPDEVVEPKQIMTPSKVSKFRELEKKHKSPSPFKSVIVMDSEDETQEPIVNANVSKVKELEKKRKSRSPFKQSNMAVDANESGQESEPIAECNVSMPKEPKEMEEDEPQNEAGPKTPSNGPKSKEIEKKGKGKSPFTHKLLIEKGEEIEQDVENVSIAELNVSKIKERKSRSPFKQDASNSKVGIQIDSPEQQEATKDANISLGAKRKLLIKQIPVEDEIVNLNVSKTKKNKMVSPCKQLGTKGNQSLNISAVSVSEVNDPSINDGQKSLNNSIAKKHKSKSPLKREAVDVETVVNTSINNNNKLTGSITKKQKTKSPTVETNKRSISMIEIQERCDQILREREQAKKLLKEQYGKKKEKKKSKKAADERLEQDGAESHPVEPESLSPRPVEIPSKASHIEEHKHPNLKRKRLESEIEVKRANNSPLSLNERVNKIISTQSLKIKKPKKQEAQSNPVELVIAKTTKNEKLVEEVPTSITTESLKKKRNKKENSAKEIESTKSSVSKTLSQKRLPDSIIDQLVNETDVPPIKATIKFPKFIEEPVTPERPPKTIGGFKESPITPKILSNKFRVSIIKPTKPEKRVKKKLTMTEPTNVMPRPVWTTAGVFVEEPDTAAKQNRKQITTNSTTNFIVENIAGGSLKINHDHYKTDVVEFKKKQLFRANVPRRDARHVLNSKRFQTIQSISK